jgi:tripartite-type tricarboxylate transporter receptor subunit TctC
MKQNFRRLMLAFAAALLLPGAGHAEIPGGAITLMVPYSPGGLSDVLARAVAPSLGKALGRNVIVENLTGASGSIAATKVLSTPTGQQIFVASGTEAILAPLTLKAVKYGPADFQLLGLVSQIPLAVFVRNELPVHSVDELVQYSRKAGSSELSYGSVGPGSLFHLAGDSLAQTAGIKATHVPYRGGMPMLQDLMAGHIDFGFAPADATLSKLAVSGKMRALAIATTTRSPAFPGIPTFSESKSVPGFSVPPVWVGLMVPTSTPEATVLQLQKAVQEAMASPEVLKAVEQAGGAVPPAMTLAQSSAFLRDQATQLAALLKAAKLEPN